jgi:hypothetical protein
MNRFVVRGSGVACLAVAVTVLLLSCTTQMQVTVERMDVPHDFQPKPADHEVLVLQANDSPPTNALLIARLKLRDTGLTVDCGYEKVLGEALAEARELGGDLIQLVRVYPPDLQSSCYRLNADVYALAAGETPE